VAGARSRLNFRRWFSWGRGVKTLQISAFRCLTTPSTSGWGSFCLRRILNQD
jgi:hypothetical protein